ncbi:AAA domain-containing protein ['Camptotheca acuminata' phytoplasma]|uniref:AAA domain-containing protein n=1 Tax='Camptotheca acuminata' phytoplasma TaxID=3239192 RepID=UPI00351A6E15
MTIKHQRLSSLIEFVKETSKLSESNKYFSDVNEHELSFFEDELRKLPGVYVYPQVSETHLWLVVERSLPQAAPQVDNSSFLKFWLDVSNDYNIEPKLKSKILKSDILTQKSFLNIDIDSFSDNEFIKLKDFLLKEPKLKEEFDDYWHAVWYPWTLKEKKRAETRVLYDKLYKLEKEFKTNEDDLLKELVIGSGMVLWKRKGLDDKMMDIRYPLIVHELSLNMNEETSAIEITAKGKPQILLDLYTSVSNMGVQNLESEWMQWQKDLSSNDEKYFSPFELDTFNNILQKAASNLDSRGEYITIDPKSDRSLPSITNEMKITDTWVIFLRPRSNKFLLQDLQKFQDQLQSSTKKELPELPKGISALFTEPDNSRLQMKLTEFRGIYYSSYNENSEDAEETENKIADLYSTMPANEEQLKIIQKLEFYDGVVVQGPPGTGKTHTIANILSHYLTLGKRVLITSMKKTALNVLKNKLLPSIRPLAVSLLSNDQEDNKQLENSVTTIKNTINSINEDEYNQEIEFLTKKIDNLYAEISRIEKETDQLFKKQYQKITLQIDNRSKTFSPSEAARFLSENESNNYQQWLLDKLSIENEPLFLSKDLKKLKSARLAVGESLSYYNIDFPDVPTDILKIIDQTHQKLTIYNQIKQQIDNKTLPSLSDTNDAVYQSVSELRIKINEYIVLTEAINEKSLRFEWHNEIEQKFKKSFSELPITKFDDFYEELQEVVKNFKSNFVSKPVILNDPDIVNDNDVISAILRKTKGKSFFRFLQKNTKSIQQKIDTINLVNEKPKSVAEWQYVYDFFQLQKQMRKLIIIWNQSLAHFLFLSPIIISNSFLPLTHVLEKIKEDCDHYNMMIQKFKKEQSIIEIVSKILPQYDLSDAKLDDFKILKEIDQILKQHYKLYELQKYPENKAEIIKFFNTESGDILIKITQFIEEKLGNSLVSDSDFKNEWDALYKELVHLQKLKKQFIVIKEVTESIENSGAILWAQSLRSQPSKNEDDLLIPFNWTTGWLMRQLASYVKLDFSSVMQKLESERFLKINDLKKAYEKIVERRTWLQVFQKMNPNIESALQSFTTYITKIGKGTGKKAINYRKEANEALNRVIESQAIPCFIMTHDKVSEILPSQFGMFDLVIIDEASQSNISALSVLLRSEKILIVGDDKQISPIDMLDVDKVNNLMKSLLHSQVKSYKGHINAGSSIYELFQVVFAHQKIMLKEHFRSVKPIIEYSNREFYNHEIQPMRYPTIFESLEPPLIDVLVTDGQNGGDGLAKSQVINKSEAHFIVNEIKAICKDPQMLHKTIGIVTLLGEWQEKYIIDVLNQQIPLELQEKHKIKCGNPRIFQGEERDIMFISLVVSFYPQQKKPFALTKEDAKQRFNVAASRARDRMYLVRSVELDQLSSKDVLRRGLINHFKSPFLKNEKIIKDSKLLFESKFEQEIYDILMQKGYRVIPQLKVGNYLIDMIVEGENDLRFAIECDGDKFHGAGQFNYDFNRQKTLERNGWQFWRVFASDFYKNKNNVIQDLINCLKKKGIKPISSENVFKSSYTQFIKTKVFGEKTKN